MRVQLQGEGDLTVFVNEAWWVETTSDNHIINIRLQDQRLIVEIDGEEVWSEPA